MKRVFVCSPYAGDIARNVAVAEALCRTVIEQGAAPYAPHLLYPRFLDDSNPVHRELGIAAGFEFLAACHELWAFVERGRHAPSSGMVREIAFMRQCGLPALINPNPFLALQYKDPSTGALAFVYADSAYEDRARRELERGGR